ncbi:hypothetical protein RJ639_015293 [Escallonia herrerae]|uniref:Transposase (putative) gypsy type domain-containing protein n=1 Tax=Escallonia herrerae TaxID=1293975 RepID=A0AA88VH45_9ASTE|nr:hypothetical protein RJ639_015293 [Escallonia herrerae]
MPSTPSSSSLSTSSSSTENDLGTSESRSSQVGTSTLRSQVGTSTPQVSTSFSRRDALREIKDEAEDKFDEDTWFSADEKRNKMTKDSIVELLEEIPLPPPFSVRVPALQEPANYGTDLETSVYKGQIRSGYRVPMHPFAVAFFNHYKMAPGQLVPNGWRKLVGLIYLVQTSGYPVTVDDFMRLYLERPSGKWEFPRKWNGFCKDYEKKGSLAPNTTTKKLIDHIKRRGVLSIDEPLSDQEMRHAGLIPTALAVPVPPTPVVEPQLFLGPKTQGLAIETSSSRTLSLEMAGKGVGVKGDFLGLLQKPSKGKRKEGTGEGPCAPTLPVPPLVVEDLPIEKDPIFRPRWTIKRGDSGMPSSHVSTQHLAHGAYCYSSQMQDRFAMAMDVTRTAETDKRAAEGKADKLDKEVKNLKAENVELLTKLGRLEKRSAFGVLNSFRVRRWRKSPLSKRGVGEGVPWELSVLNGVTEVTLIQLLLERRWDGVGCRPFRQMKHARSSRKCRKETSFHGFSRNFGWEMMSVMFLPVNLIKRERGCKNGRVCCPIQHNRNIFHGLHVKRIRQVGKPVLFHHECAFATFPTIIRRDASQRHVNVLEGGRDSRLATVDAIASAWSPRTVAVRRAPSGFYILAINQRKIVATCGGELVFGV